MSKRITKYKPKHIGMVRVSQFNKSKELYTKLYLYLYSMVLDDYHTRKDTITFVFKDGKRDVAVKMKLRTAIGNLIMWKPNIDFGVTLTLDDLYDTSKFSEDQHIKHLCKIYRKFMNKVPIEKIAESIYYICTSLVMISIKFADIQGNTLGMRDIIDLANNSKEFNNILHTEYPDNTPLQFVEKDIAARNNRVAEIMREEKWSNFHPFMMAGGNINMGQMAQMLVCIGARVDLDGSVPPIIVNTNFARGLRNPTDYYLESFTCRKSLVANKYQMSDSGYTGRIIDINNADVCLDASIEDCGYPNYVELKVIDAKFLKSLDFKYIMTKSGKWKQVDSEKDFNLIGTTVKMRTITKCCAGEGKLCKACYGGISYSIEGYHSSILATHELSEPVGQKVLSTKHLIKAKVIKIVYNELMQKYFDTSTELLRIKNEYAKYSTFELGFYIQDIEDYVDMLKGKRPSKDDEEESDEDMDTLPGCVSQLVLRINGEEIPIEYCGTDLYFSNELTKLLAKVKFDVDTEVVFVDATKLIEAGETLFEVNIQNMEISVFLDKIMRFIGIKNNTSHKSIEEFLQRITEMVNSIDLDINIVHLETLLYSFIRKPDNIIERPDFRDPNAKYTILALRQANINAGALTTAMAYERLPAQFRDVKTYKKTKKGLFDVFFD